MTKIVTSKCVNKTTCRNILKSNSTLIMITLGIITGFLIAFTIKIYSNNTTSNIVQWLILPGKLFMRSLQLLILPVIFFGIITATSTFDIKNNAKVSILCVIFAISGLFIGSITSVIGSFGFNFLKISSKTEISSGGKTMNIERTFFDVLSDLLRNLIPSNIIKATMYQEMTRYKEIEIDNSKNTSTINASNETLIRLKLVEDMQSSNMLGIMVFAFLIGIASSVLKEKGEPFRKFIISVNDVATLVLKWLISLAPVGICSLIIEAVLQINDFKQTLIEVWVFALIVIICCLFHAFVTMTIIYFLITKKFLFRVIPKLIEPLILAFVSTSGAVCIPSNIRVLEEKLKLSKSIARFCVPFFTTLKSDGSVIFVTVATIFLAKINNYTLVYGDYIVIVLMTCTICLSAPPVPSASILTIIAVLNSASILNVNIAILYTVEWLLDRVRTFVNVLSHNLCTCMIDSIVNNNKNVELEENSTAENLEPLNYELTTEYNL